MTKALVLQARLRFLLERTYVLRRRGLMREQDADTHFDGLVGRALADGLLVLEDIPEEEDQGHDNVIRA